MNEQHRSEFEFEIHAEKVDELVTNVEAYDCFEDVVMDYAGIPLDVLADGIQIVFHTSYEDVERELTRWFNVGAQCRAETAAEKQAFRCD